MVCSTCWIDKRVGVAIRTTTDPCSSQSTKFSPEKFLKLASDGNDKLVLQMVKGEPNLVSYAKYP